MTWQIGEIYQPAAQAFHDWCIRGCSPGISVSQDTLWISDIIGRSLLSAMERAGLDLRYGHHHPAEISKSRRGSQIQRCVFVILGK